MCWHERSITTWGDFTCWEPEIATLWEPIALNRSRLLRLLFWGHFNGGEKLLRYYSIRTYVPAVQHFGPDWNIITTIQWIVVKFIATFMVPRGQILMTFVIPWLPAGPLHGSFLLFWVSYLLMITIGWKSVQTLEPLSGWIVITFMIPSLFISFPTPETLRLLEM